MKKKLSLYARLRIWLKLAPRNRQEARRLIR